VTAPTLPTGVSGRPAAEVAREAARLASEIIKPRFLSIDKGNPVDRTAKGRGNFVTETDLAAEEAILGLIRKEFPEHRVLSEETSNEVPDWDEGWLWVIDPLDGTGNFARGIPTFAVNIALCHDGAPVLGLTTHPITRDEFFAEQRGGLWVNGGRAQVSQAARMSEALLGIGLGYDYDRAAKLLTLLDELWPGVVTIQNIGTAALGLAYAASGRFDLYVHQYLLPWDMAPGILFVQEAGGRIITRDGDPVTIYSEGVIAGATGPVEEFLQFSAGRSWR
jgi:fructose-1,6-bisphosphatase/inositol monophosphatase family enzyme